MKRKFLAIGGALLIGALGSGLWELLKPLLGWLASASLDIVTLGLESLRDGLYADAAAQESERVSGMILSLLSGVMGGLLLAILIPPKSFLPKETEKPEDETIEASSAYTDSLKAKTFLLKRYKFIATVVLAFMLTTHALIMQRTIYVNHVASNFNRMCIIISPYLSQQQDALYHSKFAQIQTRAEYIKLMDEIHKIAIQNRSYIPPFIIY